MVLDMSENVEVRVRYYVARSLGWEVWRKGGEEPIASFTFWDDADKWGRLNLPGSYEVRDASVNQHRQAVEASCCSS